jgi:hypothetical protein
MESRLIEVMNMKKHSIRSNCEFDVNEMEESDLHFEKDNEPRMSTLLLTV